jgi:transketolase
MNPVPTETESELDELAINTIRLLSVDAVQNANSGHPGAPMGLAPLGYVLWTQVMRHSPANPNWPNRDRFVLSAGHASMLLYSLLHLTGYDVSMDDIKQFRQWRSKTPGHPELQDTPGVETTTGPLGQGFGNAVGMALAEEMLAERFNRDNHTIVDFNTYCVCSDGDIQEGVASEAASIAGNLGLGKLICIYDDNKIQLAGETKLAFDEDVGERFAAYDWHVQRLRDPVTLEDIKLALDEAKSVVKKPSLIVLRTHIGYGSPNKQDSSASHGSPLGEEEVRRTKEALGWDPDKFFYIPDEVAELFARVKEKGAKEEAAWSQRFEEYAADNPELADEFLRRMRGEPSPAIVKAKPPTFTPDEGPIATRVAGGKALNWAAPLVPELVGGSADLDPSTKTRLEGEPDVLRHTFRGRNIHFGVREHGMGAIVNGLTLTGHRAFGATFFCFMDYMRGALRLSAIMGIPATFIYTHDSIGLGEDGTTHQPIEHLATLRATPVLVGIRPADANETAQAVKFALTAPDAPTALVLSRQNLPIFDPADVPEDGVERGAYVLRDPDGGDAEVILIGTGSEVSICLEAADVLEGEGIRTRVVSMPSQKLFDRQDEEYRNSILPPSIPARVSVEAASPLGWNKWVGEKGASIGLDHFGASAPAKVLYEKFGFTPEAIAAKAKEVLEASK